MSKKNETNFKSKTTPLLKKVAHVHGISEYVLVHNDLRVLFVEQKGTGVITSDIVYAVGSRDEARGETGIAHMLEHMLFKPTRSDLKRKTDSGAMCFERETGVVLNANTWKDRTSYFFSYPKEYFERALQIEADRMHGVVLSDAEFKPEQTNVLSEFDMYAGDEYFSLAVEMMGSAFRSHTYGHETIGTREDIEGYTVEKLTAFYKKYYTPQNATLIIVGDVSEKLMKEGVTKHFAHLTNTAPKTPRLVLKEPKQEGVRTITIKRPSSRQIYALGVKHEHFPSQGWIEGMAVFDMLTSGKDSILYKRLVDTGLATTIEHTFEPSREQNLAIIYITLTDKISHEKLHTTLKEIINSLTLKDISLYLKKTIARLLMNECLARENSLNFTSELVEYVSAGAWKHFFDTEKLMSQITGAHIQERMKALFDEKNTTIGYFIGTK